MSDKWIDVKQELPPITSIQYGNQYSDLVLCFLCGICGIGQYVVRGTGPYRGKTGWDFVSTEFRKRPDNRVTHWQPLPAAPTEAKQEGDV